MLKRIILSICIGFLYANPQEYPVVILGSGVAALTAAVQVSHLGYQPLVITGSAPGGKLVQSFKIHNWPGETRISGAKLMDRLQSQAEEKGVAFYYGQVVDIDVSKRPFVIQVQNLFEKQTVETIKAETCIVALGGMPKLADVPGEQQSLYKKIFTCATCDGYQFKNKKVALIANGGSGNQALIETQFLSKIAKEVYVIAEKECFDVARFFNVKVLHAHVEAFKKTPKGLSLQLSTGESLDVHGAFLALGSDPNTVLLQGKVELDQGGYIVLKNQQETSVPGLFAAGDVTDNEFKQAITAAGDATKAAFQTRTYIDTPACNSHKRKMCELVLEVPSLENIHFDKPTAVYFYSELCPPCRIFRNIYNDWASRFQGKLCFLKISREKGQRWFDFYKVKATPTVLVFHPNGTVLRKVSGFQKLAELPHFLDKF